MWKRILGVLVMLGWLGWASPIHGQLSTIAFTAPTTLGTTTSATGTNQYSTNQWWGNSGYEGIIGTAGNWLGSSYPQTGQTPAGGGWAYAQQYFYTMQLQQGVTYVFITQMTAQGNAGLFGSGNYSVFMSLTSGSTVTSAQLAYNDDYPTSTVGSSAYFVYTPTASGTYCIALGAVDTPTAFNYTLSVTAVQNPTVNVNTAPLLQSSPTITITGSGFSSTPSQNTITFSGLTATGTVTAATSSSLTVTFTSAPSGTGALNASVSSIFTVNGVSVPVSSGAAVQVATITQPSATVNLSTTPLAVNAPSMTITGFGFSPTPANNTVVLTGVSAVGTVSAATTTSLTVTFSTPPSATGALSAVVTVAGNGSSGAPVQVATIANTVSTTTTVTGSTVSYHSYSTFSISVTANSGSAVPPGSVTVYLDNTNEGSITLTNGTTGTLEFTTTLAAGETTLTAVYVPSNSVFLASTGSAPLYVNRTGGNGYQQTVTTMGGSTVTYGQLSTFSALVAPASGTGTVSIGSITVYVNGSNAGSVTSVPGGTYQYSSTPQAVGTYTVTGQYVPGTGNSTWAGSFGGPVYMIVRYGTATNVNAPAVTSPAVPTWSATVSNTSGGPTPSGVVTTTLSAGATVVYTATATLVNGSATFSNGGLAPGTYTVNATFSDPTNNNAPSTAATQNLVVNSSMGVGTTASISAPAVTLPATPTIFLTVTPASGTAAPTGSGTVTIYDSTGTNLLATLGPITFDGSSPTFSVGDPGLGQGTYTVSANFVGSGNFGNSAAPSVSMTVTGMPSVTTITTVPTTYGASDGNFTVTVASASGSLTAQNTDTVTIYLNGASQGQLALSSSGSVTGFFTSEPAGSYPIYAVYNPAVGSPLAGSTSPTVTMVINGITTAVTLSAPTVNIPSGGSTTTANVTITVTPTSTVAGYPTGTIQLTGSLSSAVVTLSTTNPQFSLNSSTRSITFTFTDSTLGAGTYTFNGVYTASGNFQSSTATSSLTVNPPTMSTQTITFSAPPLITVGATTTLSATGGDSGNPVTFSVLSGPGSIGGSSNNVLAATGGGSPIVVAANQAGNAVYSAANQATQTLAVVIPLSAPGSASGTVSPTSQWWGTPGSAYAINTGNTLAAASCVGPLSPQVSNLGNPGDGAGGSQGWNYASQDFYAVTLSQGVAYTFTLTQLAGGNTSTTYDLVMSLTQGNALSGTQVGYVQNSASMTFTYTPTASSAGPFIVAVSNFWTGDTVPYTLTITTPPQTQTVVFNPAPSSSVVYGSAPITLSATGGSSGNPVTFSLDPSTTPGAATLSGANNSVLTITGAGTIVIDANQAGGNGYSAATQTQATITVSKAPLTITVGTGQSMIYGAAVPTLTFSAATFVNGDGPSVLSGTLTTTATATSSVGSYPISIGSLTAANYSLTLAGSPTLSITPAPLTITAGSGQSMMFGATVPALTFSAATFVNGDSVTTAVTGSLSTSATSTSVVGAYPITLGSLTSTNYSLSLAGSPTFSVTIAQLTIAPTASQSMVYGSPVPANLAYTVSGYQAGDSSATVSLSGSLGTSATATSPVGSYTFNIGTLASLNPDYSLVLASSPPTFSIAPAPLTITATTGQSMGYGQTVPVLTFTAGTFVNGDTAQSAVTGSLTTSATSTSAVGAYPITLGTLSAMNYTLSLAGSPTFSVTLAQLTISPNAGQSMIYGTTPPTNLSYVVSGYQPGDSAATVPITGSLGTSATATSPVGNGYLFTLGSLATTNPDYSLALGSSPNFAVTPAPQTITVTTSGTAVPVGSTISLSATGGGSGNPVTFSVDASSTATVSLTGGNTVLVTGAGKLIVDYNQGGNTNYLAASQTQQTIVIFAASQSIAITNPLSPIAVDQSVTLSAIGGGAGNPVTFTIDPSSTGSATISGNVLTATGAGNVVVNYNQAGNSNYVAAPQVQWNLTVTPATQSITVTTSGTPVAYGQFVALKATGGLSGNPVTFSIDPSSSASGTIVGSVLTVLTPGNLIIDYNQAGNSNYSAAPQVQQTLSVGAASQSIVVATSNATVLVGMTVTLNATGGGSGNPVTFSVDASSSGAATISGNLLTVTSAGSLNIDYNQAGNSNYLAAPQVQQGLAAAPITPIDVGSSANGTLSAASYQGNVASTILSNGNSGWRPLGSYQDWYTVALQADITYVLNMFTAGDSFMSVQDSTGKQVAWSDNAPLAVPGGTNTQWSQIVFTPPSTSTYTIICSTAVPGTPLAYTLSIPSPFPSVAGIPIPYGPTASTLSFGSYYGAAAATNMGSPGGWVDFEQDWYSVNMVTGTTYTIIMNMAGGGGQPVISLQDSGGTQVAYAASATQLVFRPSASGTYTLICSQSLSTFVSTGYTLTILQSQGVATASIAINAPYALVPNNGIVTVTLTAATGIPDGTITLSFDNGPGVTQTLQAGQTIFTIPPSTPGTHNLNAIYSGSASYSPTSTTGTIFFGVPNVKLDQENVEPLTLLQRQDRLPEPVFWRSRDPNSARAGHCLDEQKA